MASERTLVVVLEDDAQLRSAVRRLFEAEGCVVLDFDDVAAAIELITSVVPSAIVVDVDLGPGGNGFELVRKMKGIDGLADVPIVMYTGSVEAEDWEQAAALGVAGYVRKGSPPETLVGAVMSAIRLYRFGPTPETD